MSAMTSETRVVLPSAHTASMLIVNKKTEKSVIFFSLSKA